MKKLIAFGIVFVLGASVASAATIHVSIVTDKAQYVPGETVNWTIYAYVPTSDGTAGIAALGVNVVDSLGTVLNQAKMVEVSPGLGIYQLEGTAFTVGKGFNAQDNGTQVPATGGIADIYVADTTPASHQNVGQDADGLPPLPLFAKGSFTAATLGMHTLSLSLNAKNYWSSPTATTATGFEQQSLTNREYEVIPEPATLLLTGMGLGCLGLFRRRRS